MSNIKVPKHIIWVYAEVYFFFTNVSGVPKLGIGIFLTFACIFGNLCVFPSHSQWIHNKLLWSVGPLNKWYGLPDYYYFIPIFIYWSWQHWYIIVIFRDALSCGNNSEVWQFSTVCPHLFDWSTNMTLITASHVS